MESEAFYDRFTKKLVSDYLTNNRRMFSAIRLALKWIPVKSSNILDIGCGIGWSTHELASHNPTVIVKGIDLSSNSIEVANTLFKTENTSFEKLDVTKEDFTKNNIFDAVIMLDVLEHIPVDDRDNFIDSVNSILTSRGRFIVSCPTVFHQNYLKKKGEGLQPVDEDITIDILQKIAMQLNGDIIYFKYISIWHTNDYFHAVIEKNIQYDSRIDNIAINTELENITDRVKRVQKSKYVNLFNDEEFSKFLPPKQKNKLVSKLMNKIKK